MEDQATLSRLLLPALLAVSFMLNVFLTLCLVTPAPDRGFDMEKLHKFSDANFIAQLIEEQRGKVTKFLVKNHSENPDNAVAIVQKFADTRLHPLTAREEIMDKNCAFVVQAGDSLELMKNYPDITTWILDHPDMEIISSTLEGLP